MRQMPIWEPSTTDQIFSFLGGEFKLLPTKIPLYSGSLRDSAAELQKELRDIIPSPKYR